MYSGMDYVCCTMLTFFTIRRVFFFFKKNNKLSRFCLFLIAFGIWGSEYLKSKGGFLKVFFLIVYRSFMVTLSFSNLR